MSRPCKYGALVSEWKLLGAALGDKILSVHLPLSDGGAFE